MGLFGRGTNQAAATAAAPDPPMPVDDARLLAAEEAKPVAAAPAATAAPAAAAPAPSAATTPAEAYARAKPAPSANNADADDLLPDEWRAKTGEGLDPHPLKPHRRRLLLLACLCILGNELCERLAYYGVQTNMGLYLKKQLGYPADKASQLLQAWKGTVYLTPLVGAYLADAVMGRFWVILLFSTIYLLGLLGLTLVNWIPTLAPVNGAPGSAATIPVFWLAMYLMALGSGGIKPCVSSFGADQFDEKSARERVWRASFFNWFYLVINVGSLVATLVVVPIQETKGYALGFGIPTVAFGVAIAAFVVGSSLYVRFPPQGSPFARLWRVLCGAWRNRKLPLPADPAQLYEDDPAAVAAAAAAAAADDDAAVVDGKATPAASMSWREKRVLRKRKRAALAMADRIPHTEGMAFLDKAAIRPSAGSQAENKASAVVGAAGLQNGKNAPISVSVVEESKAFYRIMPIFCLVILYQMTYDPIFTLLPYPGDVMDRRLGKGGAQIPASSISFANTFGVLLTIPLYDLVLVPLLAKFRRPITVTQRIGGGFFIQILALLSAGVIETVRYRQSAGVKALYEADGGNADTTENPDPMDPKYTQPMSIWVQIVPYYLLGAGEAFTNVGVMELFYCGVSTGMRSIGTACYLLTVALGTYLATALNLIVAAATASDPWVANISMYGHYDFYFYLNAGILTLALIIYVPVSMRYVERPVSDADADPFDAQGDAHGELANVSRAWPSVRRASRVSELRARSQASMVVAGKAGAGVGLLPTSSHGAAEQGGVVWPDRKD